MKFSSVRLLVKDYRKCFEFYTQQLGLEAVWDVEECYASFKVADGIEGLAIFTSDLIAPVVGNTDKTQPVGFREKSMFSFEVDSVDETYQTLSEKGLNSLTNRWICPIGERGWFISTIRRRI